MRKLFVFISCLMIMVGVSLAGNYETNTSSNPTLSPTLGVIASSDPGDILGSLLINQRGGTNETIKIYDSSGTANNLIGTVMLSTAATGGAVYTANEYIYNIRISSAITVTKSGSTSDVTIIWNNVNGR